MTRKSARAAERCTAIAAVLLAGALVAPPVRALEEQKGEQQALDACDERLCRMLQQKTPAGEDLKCRLTKTWARSTIKEADRTELSWGFGDARCSVELNVSRASIVAAVTEHLALQVLAATAHRRLRDRAGRPAQVHQGDGGAQDRLQGRPGRQNLDQPDPYRRPRQHHRLAVGRCAALRQRRHLPPGDGQVRQWLHLQALPEVLSPRAGRQIAAQGQDREPGAMHASPCSACSRPASCWPCCNPLHRRDL